jgi:hypothetical protein
LTVNHTINDGAITVDAILDSLDYVDADGNPNNNSVRGGDAFRFRGRAVPATTLRDEFAAHGLSYAVN